MQLIKELGTWRPSAKLGFGAADEDIARWCGEAFVFVTCDADIRSRAMRMGVLSRHGVAVIFVSPQPVGLQGQVELVVRHYQDWQDTLGPERPGYSAWLQSSRGRLKKLSR